MLCALRTRIAAEESKKTTFGHFLAKIKPTGTRYNGYRFRSRTEAKWAVFFDAADLYYEYEIEGFNFNGVWYLPDFWLPDLKMWFEVKGETPTSEDHAKAKALAETSGKDVLLCEGRPENHKIHFYPADADRFSNDVYQLCDDRRNEGEFWLSGKGGHEFSIGPVFGPFHDRHPLVWSACLKGIEASKAARFEHGEQGREE